MWLILIVLAVPLQAQRLPRFEDYEATVHRGHLVPPKWISHVKGDEWRDDFGKLVSEPEVNFAGKYFIAVHSCGTGCRYYSMTDLTNGRELNLLKSFATAEPMPKTNDGYPYLTELISRANSKLLLAQYHVTLPSGEQCRERTFVLEGENLNPLTNTRRHCTRY